MKPPSKRLQILIAATLSLLLTPLVMCEEEFDAGWLNYQTRAPLGGVVPEAIQKLSPAQSTRVAAGSSLGSGHRVGENPTSATIAKPLAIYGLSFGADLAVTAWAERQGATEANPLMQNKGARYALSVAGVAGLTALDVKFQKDGHKGWARVLRVSAVLIRGYAVVHNVRSVR